MSEGSQGDFVPIEHEAYDWVMKLVSGTANASDLRALEHWMDASPEHRMTFERVRQTWEYLGPVGTELSHEGLLSRRPLSQGKRGGTVPWRPGRRAFLGGGFAAAGIAGISALMIEPPLGLWPSWAELNASYRTAAGQQRRVVLPGGVSIAMNTRTSIALRPFGVNSAGINLISGEAVVETSSTENARFVVVAGSGRVVAATARFNLWRDDRSVCVTCLDGGVTVEQEAATISLTRAQQVTYSGERLGQVENVDPQFVTSWMQGIVVFHGTPVTQVIEELNRYRPGRVILTNAALGRQKLNARFRISDIDVVISQIQQVFGARVTNLPGGIVLIG